MNCLGTNVWAPVTSPSMPSFLHRYPPASAFVVASEDHCLNKNHRENHSIQNLSTHSKADNFTCPIISGKHYTTFLGSGRVETIWKTRSQILVISPGHLQILKNWLFHSEKSEIFLINQDHQWQNLMTQPWANCLPEDAEYHWQLSKSI